MHDMFNVSISDKCVLTTDTCYDVTPFKTAKLELSMFKGKRRLMQEKIDLCSKTKKQKEAFNYVSNAFGFALFPCPFTTTAVSFINFFFFFAFRNLYELFL